jgi:hypothetical protein
MLDSRSGFGAMMTWELAEIHSPVDVGSRPRFFNPMWSLMGRPQAPGTFYWDANDPYNTHWLCIDGVLARPALRGIFRDETLRIVHHGPGPNGHDIPLTRLADKHWHIEYSDHLPILFDLEMRTLTQEDRDV